MNIIEKNTIIETFETNSKVNFWVERYWAVGIVIACVIDILAPLSLIKFFELLTGAILLEGIFGLGFVAIPIHIKYYVNFEKGRKVELYTDSLVVSIDEEVVRKILKNDIAEITLCDRFRVGDFNSSTTLVDPFYYLIVKDKNQEEIILTSLLDIRLKKKIIDWYGHKLEHRYQFFPFPPTKETK